MTDKTEELLNVGQYDGVISYLDDWDHAMSDEEADALENYVRGGGALLVLHNGICIQHTKYAATNTIAAKSAATTSNTMGH